MAMSNLAITLRDQGQLDEAANMEKEVIERRRRILDEEHPDTITAMNNLAITLRDQGQLNEAAMIQRDALEKMRRIFGEDHPTTISAMSNLAITLGDQGELDEAVMIQKDALEKTRRIFGEDHPTTISAMSNLASMLSQLDLDETATITSTRDTVFSQKYKSTYSSLTAGDGVERDMSSDLKEAIPYTTRIKQVSIWLDEQPDRQVVSSIAEKAIVIQQPNNPPSPAGYPLGASNTSGPLEIGDLSHVPPSDNTARLPTRPGRSSSSAASSTSYSSSLMSSTRNLPGELGDNEPLGAPTFERNSLNPGPNDIGQASEQEFMRFSQPEKWLLGLETLMDEVIAASALEQYINQPSRLFKIGSERLVDALVVNEALDADTKIDLLDSECHLLYAIVDGISTNLERMQKARYCTDSINIIILDSSRPLVAKLVRLRIDKISPLAQHIRSSLPSDPSAVEEYCSEFLELLGSVSTQKLKTPITSTIPDASASSGHRATILARLVVQLIDLALISYSGAHIEPFLSRFVQGPASSRLPIAPSLRLTRRTMKCLNAYLNRQVWVFEIGESIDEDSDSTPLYLSTTIEEFANVWGPAWPVYDPNSSDVLLRYNVGLGSMVHWPRDNNEPELTKEEVFCHWTTSIEDVNSASAIPKHKDQLLIGGRLRINDNCTMDNDEFTLRMENKKRLLPLGTGWPSFFIDSRNIGVQIGGGALGPGISVGETYKIRNQSYRKQLEVAVGNNSLGACIAALRNKFVIEISACTGLTWRRSLIYALGYDGMRNHLWNLVDLDWRNDEWREQYFQILRNEDVPELENALRENDRGAVFKAALKTSMLSVLLETGVDTSKMLLAFWMPKLAEIPWNVTFPSEEYSWTGLLNRQCLGI